MYIIKKLTLVVLLLTSGLPRTLAQNNVQSIKQNAKMQWWREARFGMFIHWGVYSLFDARYRGHDQRVADGAWLLNRMKVPVQEYKDSSRKFNPVKYDPEAWVKMAKNAGMKYLVITAKHHDGFALFDSKAGDWDVVDATVYGKDLLKPLVEACRKQGMKLGFYYSQEQDWGNAGGKAHRRPMKQGWLNPDSAKIDAYTLAHNGNWDPVQDTKTFDTYVNEIAIPQMRELLTNYGDIAVVFWDTPRFINKEQASRLDSLLKLQPGIITNDRLAHIPEYKGDYKTPEQVIPAVSELDGSDWESNMTMNDSWGYRSNDHKWKSTETLVRNVIDVASKGGNYLLNIGPKADGTFPEESISRLNDIGIWMKKYGAAVYGTHANPVALADWGRITAKDNQQGTTLYLSVFNWPANGKIKLGGLTNKAVSATLLGDKTNLKLTQKADGSLEISGLPVIAPDKIASVVTVKLNGLAVKKKFVQTEKMKSKALD